jgi:hypothetical protein
MTTGAIRPRDIPVIRAGSELAKEGWQHHQKRAVQSTVPR